MATNDERDELVGLRAENARLLALLAQHDIDDRALIARATESAEPDRAWLSPSEKVALFRRLFRGRVDLYAPRWESRSSGKSGYAPACGNE
jgi:hypothetical protein